MFEIVVISVILLAISYWAVLWTMGRREDVLHGEFVEASGRSEEPARSAFADRRGPADRRSPSKAELSRPKVRPIFPEPPAAPAIADKAKPSEPTPIKQQGIIPEQPARPAEAEPQAFRPERLQSLLNSIKQDLNQLVQK